MSLKVLLFGSNGMLGSSIKKYFSTKINLRLITVAHSDADFCGDFCDDNFVKNCFKETSPDFVINAAAIVDILKCEQDKLNAYLVNARFVSILCEMCALSQSFLIHISTDHYYLGEGRRKHSETEQVVFLNEYARTKFCGESLALSFPKSLVVRTNIVGFRNKKGTQTFLEWAISAIQKKEKMRLFTDFFTSSIHTVQFAHILYDLLLIKPCGIFNVASCDVFSKKEFILSLSQKLFNSSPPYEDASVLSSLNCVRASSLGLDTRKVESLLGYTMPNLPSVIESIKKEYEEIK